LSHLLAFVAYFAALLIVADLYRRIRSLQSCVRVLADRALKVNSELWRMQRRTDFTPPQPTTPPRRTDGLQPGDVHPFTPDAVVSISDASR
jgi:hypothetical protein